MDGRPDLQDFAEATGDASPLSHAVRQNAAAMRARDARGRRTMASLHAALLELIEEQPFERITVDHIVDRAKVGRSTFYRHYADKDALIAEIAQAEIEQLLGMAIPLLEGADTLPSSLHVARQVDAHRKLWSVLLTGGAVGVMRQRFAELAQARGAAHTRHRDVRVPLDLAAAWGVAATFEVLAWWLRQPDPLPVEDVADLLDRLAVKPALDGG